MEYVCKKRCFYKSRLWGVGEFLTPLKGEKLPKFFEPRKKGEAVQEVEEPKTFTEINSKLVEEEKKALDAALGVKKDETKGLLKKDVSKGKGEPSDEKVIG